MPKAIVIHEYGGPEVLKWEDHDPGEPGPGELRIRHNAMGLNYRDVYHRNGSYGVPGDEFPAVIGSDGAGVVEAVGAEVSEFKAGDRVAYGTGPMGSYAEVRNFPERFALPIPDDVEDRIAAAMVVKGLTAHNLIRTCYEVKAGETILIHAVAGGVGLIACQWAAALGATVIGTASSEEKAKMARAHGCHHVIDYTTENFAERVNEITDGAGVPVIFDGVGAATYEGDLECLAPLGFLIGYGNASGNFPKVEPLDLMHKGSLYFQRISGNHFNTTRETLLSTINEMFDLVRDGTIDIEIGGTYPLREARQAHIDLEGRKTKGSVVYTV